MQIAEPPHAVLARLRQQFSGGANWFFWIAGLSMVNAVVALSGSGWHFLAGLAATEVVAGIALGLQLGQLGKLIAFALAAFIAGVFVLFGILARKGRGWAFVVGMLLYAADGAIYAYFEDWFSAGFHVFALLFIFQGARALRALKNAAAQIAEPAPHDAFEQ